MPWTACLQNPGVAMIQSEQPWALIWGLLIREIAIYLVDRRATHPWGASEASLFSNCHESAFSAQWTWAWRKAIQLHMSLNIFALLVRKELNHPTINVRDVGKGGCLFTQESSYTDLKTTAQRKPSCLPDVAFLKCLILITRTSSKQSYEISRGCLQPLLHFSPQNALLHTPLPTM